MVHFLYFHPEKAMLTPRSSRPGNTPPESYGFDDSQSSPHASDFSKASSHSDDSYHSLTGDCPWGHSCAIDCGCPCEKCPNDFKEYRTNGPDRIV
jgi:hypothetical protein